MQLSIQLNKIIFALGFLFFTNHINGVLPSAQMLNEFGQPNFEEVKTFFYAQKLKNVYINNLPENQKYNWLGHEENLLQELFEGLCKIHTFSQQQNTYAIELISETLSTLFNNKWQAFYSAFHKVRD